jgi:protein-S-isoprenylcysteine O-methyltransferase
MTLSSFLSLAILLFPISEIALALVRRASNSDSLSRDRGSMWILWVTITLSVVGSIAAQRTGVGRMSIPAPLLNVPALSLMLCGLAIRWAAILTLGRYFTVNVAIARDHRIVQSGLYRFVRHPSYSGLLLAFVGMGLSFHNWLSLALLILPITGALALRIAVEERALRAAFGAEYEAYSARTWRLVPWLL